MEIVEVGADVGEQLRHRLDDHRAVAGGVKRGLEAIAHERCVGGHRHGCAKDEDVISREYRARFVADCIRFSL